MSSHNKYPAADEVDYERSSSPPRSPPTPDCSYRPTVALTRRPATANHRSSDLAQARPTRQDGGPKSLFGTSPGTFTTPTSRRSGPSFQPPSDTPHMFPRSQVRSSSPDWPTHYPVPIIYQPYTPHTPSVSGGSDHPSRYSGGWTSVQLEPATPQQPYTPYNHWVSGGSDHAYSGGWSPLPSEPATPRTSRTPQIRSVASVTSSVSDDETPRRTASYEEEDEEVTKFFEDAVASPSSDSDSASSPMNHARGGRRTPTPTPTPPPRRRCRAPQSSSASSASVGTLLLRTV